VHQSLLAAATCVGLLLASACSPGGSDEADDPPPTTRVTTTTTVAPTTTTTPSTQDQVEQAYEDFLDMFDRITTTNVDPNDPELTMRMTEPALGTFRTQLSTWQAQGQVWITGDETRHTITSVQVHRDRLTADVIDCVVENDALVARGTTALTFPPTQTNRGLATMVNRDGRWLVEDTDPRGHWEGVAGCAA
jgi:hypothetical protein